MTKTVATKVSAHITSAFLGGAFATAQFRHYNAWEGDLSGISPDELALTMALPVAVFAVIFGTGHFALRSINVRARLMYPFLGAVALISASLAAMPMELTQTAVEKGIVSIFLALTSAIGALIGFLHLRSAGYEVDEDEIAQFEHTISMGVDDSLESMTTSSLHDFPEKSAQHQQQEAVPSRDGEIKDEKIGDYILN